MPGTRNTTIRANDPLLPRNADFLLPSIHAGSRPIRSRAYAFQQEFCGQSNPKLVAVTGWMVSLHRAVGSFTRAWAWEPKRSLLSSYMHTYIDTYIHTSISATDSKPQPVWKLWGVKLLITADGNRAPPLHPPAQSICWLSYNFSSKIITCILNSSFHPIVSSHFTLDTIFGANFIKLLLSQNWYSTSLFSYPRCNFSSTLYPQSYWCIIHVTHNILTTSQIN
jgi:hypothetical protein